MNFANILNEISKADPEVFERTGSRRDIFKGFGAKLAAVAIPTALGTMFKKAYGGTTDSITDILNFALKLEYLESRFYSTALLNSTLFPTSAAYSAIQTISNHETAHVNFLRTAITSSGGTPVSEPAFDFTAGGTFPTVFTDYATFLAVAQTFEDTGVRAYKGQAGGLMSNNDVLTAALQIHSAEARHASHIRQMRNALGSTDVKPWITGNNSGIGSSAVQASYNGEEVTKQAGVEIVNINGQSISSDAASEAFDEPLTKDQILAIVTPFFV